MTQFQSTIQMAVGFVVARQRRFCLIRGRSEFDVMLNSHWLIIRSSDLILSEISCFMCRFISDRERCCGSANPAFTNLMRRVIFGLIIKSVNLSAGIETPQTCALGYCIQPRMLFLKAEPHIHTRLFVIPAFQPRHG